MPRNRKARDVSFGKTSTHHTVMAKEENAAFAGRHATDLICLNYIGLKRKSSLRNIVFFPLGI